MANEETPEELALREKAEIEAVKKIELTDEQFEAELEKRLGAKSSELIKKTDVLSDDDKKIVAEKKKQQAFTTALNENRYTQSEYDEFQQAQATDKIEIAKRKFLEDNADLTEDDFYELYPVNEDDEIDDGNEGLIPNKKKKAAIADLTKRANDHLKDKYKKIIESESWFDKYSETKAVEKKNSEVIAKSIAAIPTEFEFEVDLEDVEIEGWDKKVKFPISKEDIEEVAANYAKDKNALRDKELNGQDITDFGLAYIQAKNIKKMISETVKVAVTKAKEAYERGEKGIIPVRKDATGSLNKKEEFLKSKGIEV